MNFEDFKFIPILSENLKFNKLSKNEYILCNSFHRHYLKINIEVYNLISMIDGVSTIETITSNFNKKSGKNLSCEKVYQLIYVKLGKYGILRNHEEVIKQFSKPSYLSLSFIIISENTLSKFVKFFYFLFNKNFAVIVTIISISIIISLLILNFDLYQTFDLQRSVVYFVIVMAISVTFHEIGHATSASYFGAKHGGIGGGFYLFTPVYFADVTDIWSLSKKQRIVVNISGMYFELIFCSILSLFAFFFNLELLLIISIIVCLHTLFNLNPFLRSDGFWILSDLVNKPNLFFHAFNKVKDLYRFIKGETIRRWTWIDILLFIYGFISLTFISMFLFYILIKNPNSIIYFPKNFIFFLKNIFDNDSTTSLIQLGELSIPLLFYYILFNFSKKIFSSYFQTKTVKQRI